MLGIRTMQGIYRRAANLVADFRSFRRLSGVVRNFFKNGPSSDTFELAAKTARETAGTVKNKAEKFSLHGVLDSMTDFLQGLKKDDLSGSLKSFFSKSKLDDMLKSAHGWFAQHAPKDLSDAATRFLNMLGNGIKVAT